MFVLPISPSVWCGQAGNQSRRLPPHTRSPDMGRNMTFISKRLTGTKVGLGGSEGGDASQAEAQTQQQDGQTGRRTKEKCSNTL